MVTINQIKDTLIPPLDIPLDVDGPAMVIALLRKRIPFKEVYNIIYGVDHEIIYLCTVDEAAPYLTEEDLRVLAYCGCELDENDYRLTVST